ncbi:MAG: RecX family transcriptional regulator [Bacteroidetes bacterium]|nr:RecX family transcriptional regulator [Bacteroidota bacterium]
MRITGRFAVVFLGMENKEKEPSGATKGSVRGPRMAQLMNYCARQERSLQQVRAWMERRGVDPEKGRDWEQQLTDQGYLNEWRFAALYARSKMRQKKWGLAKIRMGLIRQGISTEHIEAAMDSMEVEEQQETLHKLAETKWGRLNQYPIAERRIRLMRFLHAKGYTVAQARSEAYRLSTTEEFDQQAQPE